ncbi:MAG: transglycosylase domain-containing protein [Myxococcota bacterium]
MFVGLALGVAVAVPGVVERGAYRIISSAERSLDLSITIERFDWNLDGQVTIVGLKAQSKDAAKSDALLLEVPTLDAEVEVLWTRAKLRLLSARLNSPVLRPTLRPDGSHNLTGVVERLKGLVTGSKSKALGDKDQRGLGAWIDRTMPELQVEGMALDVQLNHPGIQSAGIPAELYLKGGTFDARNTALLREDDNLSWTLAFEDSTLDPGHGFVIKGTTPVRDFDPLRVPLDVRFDRRIELGLRDRVAGLSGLSWDGSDLVLEGLTLSRNAALEGAEAANNEPALETGSITVEPDVEATIEAAKAVLSAKDRGYALTRLLKTIRRVDIDRPRFVFARRAEGHNFRDLLPNKRGGEPRQEDYDDQALGPLMKATLSAVDRLVASKPDRDGRSFRGFLLRGFSHLERRIAGVSATAIRFAESVPFRQVRVRGGHFAWRDEADTTAQALEERFENFDLDLSLGHDVLTFDAAFQVAGGGDDVNRITGKVQRTSGGVQLRARLDGLGLSKYRHALPASLQISPTTRLYKTDMTLVWSPTTEVARIAGKVAVDDLGFHYRPLATQPLAGIDFNLDFEAQLDLGAKTLSLSQSKLKVGEVSSVVKLDAEDYATAPKLSGVFRLHRARAQDVVDAIPTQLIPLLTGLKVKGTFAWQLDFSLDTSDMESLTYEAYPELNQFEVLDMGERLNIDAVQGTFMHQVREADGKQVEMLIGPDSPSWVPKSAISKYMIKAVTTTEDGSFFRHEGFSPFAIKQSIITNLKKGAFVRGASTISQQLVKNLFLTREKTISRKLQELFITWQLESNLSKAQIMELYLNVIEFGPGIYGIRRAARHYFGKKPSGLSALESVFLASIIPNPKRYYYQYTRGEVTDRWRRHLRWIMRVMVDRRKLSEAEFLAAAPYSPLFRSKTVEEDVVDPSIESPPVAVP